MTPQQRIEQRRTQLIDAAVDLFGTVGYRAATVDDLCARAGLSKRYFYESFSSSEELLLASYQRCTDEILEAMVRAVTEAGTTVDDQLRAALSGYFGAIEADQRRARITLLEILGVSPAVSAAYVAQTERFAYTVQALAPDVFAAGELPTEQLHLIAQGIIGAITTIAAQWLLEDRRRPCTQLIDASHLLVLAVLDGLPTAVT
ncbi:TetR/AcrR family transcriptional regulator [Mycobacteroides sp. LB1]|uniref:TetR/AcrR family transcriptional regulator n=1 Tax=Mycobacteroides sp. LB1 TaxID=2750814 RepID=UPI001C5CD3B8